MPWTSEAVCHSLSQRRGVQRLKEFQAPVEYGRGEMLYEEEDIALLAVGSMVSTGRARPGEAKGGGLELHAGQRPVCQAV